MAREAELPATLEVRVAGIAERLEDGTLGVSVYDYLSGFRWSWNGDRWFHAASLIKLAVLAALFDACDRGRFTLESRLHIRNRFLSAADGLPFAIDAGRDADLAVHAAVGRTMRLSELAEHMITASSNLATNLLLDLVGLDEARAALAGRGVAGVDLQRGVEDDRAFRSGCINRVTPQGAVELLRVIVDAREFSGRASTAMLRILCDQQFAGGILPGLPEAVRPLARVAHKTGEISTATHDAGVVFLPGRPPYAVAILSEGGDAADRSAALGALSAAVYDAVAASGESAWR